MSARSATQEKLRRTALRPNRVAIVGTGYIADFHARAIQGLEGVHLVSVCDANMRAAETFARSWGVPSASDSIEGLLCNQEIDTVHVLTPPSTHHSLAKTALQFGCHVFLEKPMCISLEEADDLLLMARAKGLRLGVNHNFLYTGAYARLRDVVHTGKLGPLDHLSINYFYELEQVRFGPFDAWMLREPGNVILEIGPHLVSALLDLVGAPDDISVIADRQVDLPSVGRVYRRWRVQATVGRTATDINVNLGPGFSQRTICVRGLLGSATLDFDANTCTIDRRTPTSIDIDRYRRTRSLARQLATQARGTFADYMLSRLGLRGAGNPYQVSILNSVAAFYAAVGTTKGLDARIDGEFGRRVVGWCTRIVHAAEVRQVDVPQALTRGTAMRPTVLVLGGAGFIGRELIRNLLTDGYCVRSMVRNSATLLGEFDSDRLEIVRGDLRVAGDLEAAMQGIEFVYHLARGEAKTWPDYERNEVEPTRAIGEACLAARVRRLIYTGTIDSYYAGAWAGTITEDTQLDRNIARRNYYARAKAKSEHILAQMHIAQGLPVVIFRPGIVIGRGGNPFHWGIGRFSEGVCEVWGDGRNHLPFVLVSDVASALVRGIQIQEIEGRSYNLVDIPLLTAREYLVELEKLAGIPLEVHYRSIWQLYLSDLVKWGVKLAVGHPDRIRIPSYWDWESRTQNAQFDCQRARKDLGWAPVSNRQRIVNEGIGGSLETWLAACSN